MYEYVRILHCNIKICTAAVCVRVCEDPPLLSRYVQLQYMYEHVYEYVRILHCYQDMYYVQPQYMYEFVYEYVRILHCYQDMDSCSICTSM